MAGNSNLTPLVPIGWKARVLRSVWNIVATLLYRPTPVFMHSWRCKVLRLFGANISSPAYPYPDAKIWAPWNLTMGRGSCLGPGVECYNVTRITLDEDVLVSQRSFLCSASHDYNRKSFNLIGGEILLESGAWIAAEAFVGPGITIGKESVVLARAVVVRDTTERSIVGGNPAVKLKERVLE